MGYQLSFKIVADDVYQKHVGKAKPHDVDGNHEKSEEETLQKSRTQASARARLHQSGGLLTNTEKALSIGFGGLLVAKTFVSGQRAGKNDEWIVRLDSFGRYALGLFLLISGVQHFIFIDFVKFLVPAWVPGAIFWTYLGGVALIAASLGLLTGIKAKLAASLSGWVIFIWWIVLHIPRAVTGWSDGNEWTAVFEALSVSGLLFLVGNEISSKEN